MEENDDKNNLGEWLSLLSLGKGTEGLNGGRNIQIDTITLVMF